MSPSPVPRRGGDARTGGTGVFWFRRDLRLADNPALEAALGSHEAVVPLFVWDPRLVRPAGPARLGFLLGCLAELDRALGGHLVVRRGDPVEVVPAVAAQAGARLVWCTGDFGPYGLRRDREVATALARRGRALSPVSSPYAIAPGTLRTGRDGPYQVFTPFWRAWQAAGPVAPPGGRPRRPRWASLASAGLPPPPRLAASLPAPGEAAASRRLGAFVEGPLGRYGERRDRLDEEATSRLSPYLKLGCLHPRQVLALLDPASSAHRAFARQLCWRDFYAEVLFDRPDSARAPFRAGPVPAADTGARARDRFAAWAEGRTGFPVVDAAMRQLLAEAWMPNRARMVVASFLVRDLHLDWRWGARWFMTHLVDGDLASNQHGWQWAAGTGPGSPPAFQVFNPFVQGARFDPSGDYTRRFVPELAGLAGASVHDPAALAGATGYLAPMVDHALERLEDRARYQAARQARQARQAARQAAAST